MVNFTAADRVGSIGGYIGGISALLGGAGNWLNGGGCCSENTPVTRYEQGLVIQNSQKDAENALLRAQIYSDGKLVETVNDYTTKINALAAEVRANKEAQTAVNMEQAMYNGANTATISCIKGQVDELLSLTKRVIPNGSVCPGWGRVGVQICDTCGNCPGTTDQ